MTKDTSKAVTRTKPKWLHELEWPGWNEAVLKEFEKTDSFKMLQKVASSIQAR